MFQLDEDFLVSLGLGNMPTDEKEAFLAHIYEELELRVGTELSKGLSDEQLETFEKLIDKGSDGEAVTWLEKHCPNYKEVVRQEIDKLRSEIMENRDKLLGDFPVAA